MSKKICLLVSSLSSGGAEKVATNLSKSFSERGYEVTIFSMRDEIDYHYIGKLYNFGIIKKRHGKLKAFFKFLNFFKKNHFDFIIDHRLRNKFLKETIFSKLVFNNHKVIYCVHNYDLSYYFSFLKIKWLSRFPHVKNKQFVSVSKSIKHKLSQCLGVTSRVIYNYIDYDSINTLANEVGIHENDDYIIGVGRLTTIKQFDKLILSYHKSKLLSQNIKLIILGSGPEKEKLEKLIIELNLKNKVNILPFRKNPYALIKNAKGLILSSKIEGFPMVLLEALFLKTPVISFDCKSGPNEIVKHNVNGKLVENQNIEKLTNSLNDMFLNKNMYKEISKGVSIGLDVFSEKTIIQQWINFLEKK